MPVSNKIWLGFGVAMSFMLISQQGFGQCPEANPILGSNTVCPGSEMEFTTTFDNSATNTYQWEISGGAEIMGSSTSPTLSVRWQDANGGPYEVKLIERNGPCTFENTMETSVADDIARGPVNCIQEVNMPFDDNCEKLITPGLLLTTGEPVCAGGFDVTLTVDGLTFVDNPVPISYAGQVIIATVIHKDSDQKCTSYITLQDGTNPQLTCTNDTTTCLDPNIWNPFDSSFTTPSVTDNCDSILVPERIRSEWFDLFEDPEFAGYVRREWSATDKAGNTGFCEDTIWLKKIVFEEIVCPPDTVILCDSFLKYPDNPLISGTPMFEEYALYAPEHQCEFSISYKDQMSERCAGSYVIDRTWTIKSFATSDEHTTVCKHRIEVVDTTGPQIIFDDPKVRIVKHPDLYEADTSRSYKTLYYPTLDFGCVAHGYLPAPKIHDNCSPLDSLTIDLIWETGHITYRASDQDPHLLFKDLPKGKHIVRVVARDDCHNQTKDTLVIVTEDRKAPYIVADKDPQVTLATYAKVTWIDVSVFDEGTTDNCHLLTVVGRRIDWDSACYYTNDSLVQSEVRDHYDHYYEWVQKDSIHCKDSLGYGWSDQIPFCCEDACSGKPVVVELMAIDAYCNVAKLWVNVTVEDATKPEIAYKLEDLTISCKAYQEHYQEYIDSGRWDVFGTYERGYHSYEEALEQETHTVIKDIVCLDPPTPIYGDEETYPEYERKPIDYIFDEVVYDTIQNGLVYDNCGLSVKEKQKVEIGHCGEGWIERVFTFAVGCGPKRDSIKVVQRIEIVNDCPFYEAEVIWPAKDTTVYGCGITEVETAPPHLRFTQNCREIGIHHEDQITDQLYNSDSTCHKIIRTWAVIDWCRQNEDYHEDWYGKQAYHYYEYEQHIYVKDTLGPVIANCDLDTLCIGTDCSYDLNHTLDISDNCTPLAQLEVEWSLYRVIEEGFHLKQEGNTALVQVDSLIAGEFKLVVSVEDGCSIVSYCTDYFEVLDCKKPTPVCVTATTVKLFPVDLDFDGIIDTAVGEIWADELNLSSHDNCDPDLSDFRIRMKGAGEVNDDGTLLPPDVEEKQLSFGCPDIGEHSVELWVVDAQGNADFCEVIINVQSPFEGCSVDTSINGTVTGLSGAGIGGVRMVLQNDEDDDPVHAMSEGNGRYRFNETVVGPGPHRLHGQKEDNSVNGISTADLIQMAQHVIGRKEFTDFGQLYAADVNGDGHISVRDLITLRKLLLAKIDSIPGRAFWHFFNLNGEPQSNLAANTMDKEHLNFTGVKLGDVNGDATYEEGQGRSNHSLALNYTDRYMQVGQRQEIAFRFDQDVDLTGLQLELGSSGRIAMSNLVSGSIAMSEDNWSLDRDQLYLSWNTSETAEIPAGETIFTLIVEVQEAGRLSDMLSLGSRRLTPELYDLAAQPISLTLASDLITPQSVITAAPNPFRSSTSIQFDLTSAGLVTVDIYDHIGRLVSTQERSYPDGLQELVVDRSRLGAAGTYHLILSSDAFQQRISLLLID